MGPRGTGKTAIVEAALAETKLIGVGEPEALLVRLDGYLDTTDRIALRRITKQLKLENVVEGKVFGSFAEHLEFLLASLKTGDKEKSKPIVVILEEFDLFCSHHNQTLLYNLFDTAQSKAAPILIIGITARIDVVELLEKRVLSRFGRRSIHIKKIVDFQEFYEFVKYFFQNEEASAKWNKEIEKALATAEAKQLFETRIFNKSSSLANLKSIVYETLIYTRKKRRDDEDVPELNIDISVVLDRRDKSGEEHIMLSLTRLDLALLVACLRRQVIHPTEPMNFEMVFNEFRTFVSRKCPTLNFDRHIMIKCWENLANLEILRPVDQGSRIQNEYRSYVLNVLETSVQDVLKKHPNILPEIEEWSKI